MKKNINILIAILLLLTACSGGSKELRLVSFRGEVFGTYYSVSYYSADGRNYQAAMDSLFRDINQSLSYYVPNSLLSRINRNETNLADGYFLAVLERSLEVAEQTSGAFDPTVSPLVNAWGFGFDNALSMTPEVIDSLKRITGYERVRIEQNRIIKDIPEIQFDFNAIAKGYAADLAGQLLEARGIETYLVELGGDLIARGLKPDGTPWRIGIEKPAKDMLAPQDWAFLVEMHNRALATSGSTRKYYMKDGQRLSHTIDPSTGRPVQHNLLSVSVFANTCMMADAFATAFMVMGLEKSVEFVENRDDLDAFFIYSEAEDKLNTYTTPGLKVLTREEVESDNL
ncbi:MAG: FAD:protein FMN transferase [Bacteroidetes bacterium]|nr:MAG: FAD:protein FMN transferase [Bacteroidota bacterium]